VVLVHFRGLHARLQLIEQAVRRLVVRLAWGEPLKAKLARRVLHILIRVLVHQFQPLLTQVPLARQPVLAVVRELAPVDHFAVYLIQLQVFLQCLSVALL